MTRSELFALIALIFILFGIPAAALGYQFVLRPALANVRTIDITAAAPEAGGFQPDHIRVAAGETVRLRFSVPDVTHGIAIGPGLGLDLGHVDPGQVSEVEVIFDRPGRFTFYCNSWCSPNHWRMRGIIEVYDPTDPDALVVDAVPDPVLVSLIARGVDIDMPHESPAIPVARPSATRGMEIVEQLGAKLPPALADPAWRQSHSPAEAWKTLVERGLDGDEAWDGVAYLWLSEANAGRLQSAATLYAKNCAACHGENGDGQGPAADALTAQDMGQDSDVGMARESTAFTEPRKMLGGSSQVYYAKLRRGGMGTGMPSFGSIFTPEETWSLVDFLWTFVFDR